jgi:uncharacterized protein (TIGR03083 family)
MTPGQLYAEARTRLSDLVRSMPDDQLAITVPATPKWTVKDVVAHLVGGPTDLLDGVFGGPGGFDEWTADHVSAREGKTLDEVLDEWAAISPKVEEALEAEGSRLVVLLADVVTHEQDVRNATGNQGARDSAGIDWALQFFTGTVGHRLKEAGTPALRIRAGKDEWLLGGGSAGDGEPAATVDVDEYELVRGMVGRRSEAQVRSWRWQGDPEPYLPYLSVFPFPVAALLE